MSTEICWREITNFQAIIDSLHNVATKLWSLYIRGGNKVSAVNLSWAKPRNFNVSFVVKELINALSLPKDY